MYNGRVGESRVPIRQSSDLRIDGKEAVLELEQEGRVPGDERGREMALVASGVGGCDGVLGDEVVVLLVVAAIDRLASVGRKVLHCIDRVDDPLPCVLTQRTQLLAYALGSCCGGGAYRAANVQVGVIGACGGRGCVAAK